MSSKEIGFEQDYTFDLHYDLPFPWDGKYQFKITDGDELKTLIGLRDMAQGAISTFMADENLRYDIRIWPHHFDTGTLMAPEGLDTSIGMGLAIPDSVVGDHYFYVSGYHGTKNIDTAHFGKLDLGEWKNEGFVGAVLPASMHTKNEVVHFLKQAYHQLLQA